MEAVAPILCGSFGEGDFFNFICGGGFKSGPPLLTDQVETSLNTSLRSPTFFLSLPLPSLSYAPNGCVLE